MHPSLKQRRAGALLHTNVVSFATRSLFSIRVAPVSDAGIAWPAALIRLSVSCFFLSDQECAGVPCLNAEVLDWGTEPIDFSSGCGFHSSSPILMIMLSGSLLKSPKTSLEALIMSAIVKMRQLLYVGQNLKPSLCGKENDSENNCTRGIAPIPIVGRHLWPSNYVAEQLATSVFLSDNKSDVFPGGASHNMQQTTPQRNSAASSPM